MGEAVARGVMTDEGEFWATARVVRTLLLVGLGASAGLINRLGQPINVSSIPVLLESGTNYPEQDHCPPVSLWFIDGGPWLETCQTHGMGSPFPKGQ